MNKPITARPAPAELVIAPPVKGGLEGVTEGPTGVAVAVPLEVGLVVGTVPLVLPLGWPDGLPVPLGWNEVVVHRVVGVVLVVVVV